MRTICQCLLSMGLMLSFDVVAYELVSEKITVSPGCTGGVLYSRTESGFLSESKQPIDLNDQSQESSFDTQESFQEK